MTDNNTLVQQPDRKRKLRRIYAFIYFSAFALDFYTFAILNVDAFIPSLVVPVSLSLIILIMQKHNISITAYIEEMERTNSQLQQMAYYDDLTGLPNRRMTIERLNFLTQRSDDEISPFTIAFIDMDDFKKINDAYGHSIGDKLLMKVTKVMIEHINIQDIFGRFGGDEFILIIQRKRLMESETFQYVDNLRTILSNPININGFEIYPSASFGISNYPFDAKDTEELLRYADIAMYSAKESGKNNIHFFDKQNYTAYSKDKFMEA